VLNKEGLPVRGEAIVVDMAGASDIPAHLVSEGTLITLGIVTVLMSDPSPEVVLLDNLDQGLHPRAQKELIGLLRKLMQQNPKLQILATTHSPYLLDHLDPKEVRLTVADEQGEAHCAKLTDCPDFAKWKDEMTPGEMWSVLGEEWVQKVCCQGAK
jgi:predicted ATPase